MEPEDGVSGKADGAEHSLDVAPEVEIRVANGAEVLGTVVYRTPVRELDEELVEEECVPVENDLKLDAEIEAAAEAIAREETRQMCVFMAEQHLKLLQERSGEGGLSGVPESQLPCGYEAGGVLNDQDESICLTDSLLVDPGVDWNAEVKLEGSLGYDQAIIGAGDAGFAAAVKLGFEVRGDFGGAPRRERSCVPPEGTALYETMVARTMARVSTLRDAQACLVEE